MDTMKINDNEQAEIFKIVCGILHLGNISFAEGNNDQAFISVLDGNYMIRDIWYYSKIFDLHFDYIFKINIYELRTFFTFSKLNWISTFKLKTLNWTWAHTCFNHVSAQSHTQIWKSSENTYVLWQRDPFL